TACRSSSSTCSALITSAGSCWESQWEPWSKVENSIRLERADGQSGQDYDVRIPHRGRAKVGRLFAVPRGANRLGAWFAARRGSGGSGGGSHSAGAPGRAGRSQNWTSPPP